MTKPVVTVVGLGPAGADLLTHGTRRLLEATPGPRLLLRTRVHPAAEVAAHGTSFDDVYEQSSTFDAVYATIVEGVVAAAAREGAVVYAVPGSPVVAEHTVERLVADPRVHVEIVPALSFLDLAWSRLRVDPLAVGVRVIDGHRFAEDAAALSGAALVAQCHSRDVLADIKLAVDTALLDDVPMVTVLHHLGLADERIVTVAWDDLDRLPALAGIEADHLTSLYVPALVSSTGRAIVRLEEQMRALRAGCPWDAEQTHRSLARYAVEEAYELVDAIEHLDDDPVPDVPDPVEHLQEELGDLLFQVVFHACLATEEGWFTLADVATTLHEKLERRHPHVFGEVEVDGPDDVARNWEQIKAGERSGRRDAADPFAGLTESLPSLTWASKVVKRAGELGVAPAPSRPQNIEQDVEHDVEAALGDELLALVVRARTAGVDPEVALRRAAIALRDAARAKVGRV